MARRTKQWHRMLSPGWADPKVSSFALWLLEFVVVLACAAHDAQNALKWSTKAEFDSSELLRGAYLGIESIRNSFDVILIYLSSWIVQSLTFANSLFQKRGVERLTWLIASIPLCSQYGNSRNLVTVVGSQWVRPHGS